MADPLHSDSRSFNDIRSFDQRNELNRGSRIAPTEDTLRMAELHPERELPGSKVEHSDHQLPGSDDPLVRAAEQIGGVLGKTVSQVRRMPGTARNGIHLVTDRAQSMAEGTVNQLSSKASELAGNAQQRASEIGDIAQTQARELADRAQQRLRELMDLVEERGGILLDRAEELGQQMCDRTNELRHQLDDRTRELRMNARMRAEQVKWQGERVVRERPLHVIGGIAAAAFLLGISLRIVRSRHARGY